MKHQPQIESKPHTSKWEMVMLTLLSVVFLVLFVTYKSLTDDNRPVNEPLPKGLFSRDGKIYSETDGAEMVLIPAGEFEMGTDEKEIPELVKWAKRWHQDIETSWFADETPRHTVNLDAFYIDVYEVTNAL